MQANTYDKRFDQSQLKAVQALGKRAPSSLARAVDDAEACSEYMDSLIDVITSSGNMETVLAMLLQLGTLINDPAKNGLGVGCTIDELREAGEAANSLADQIITLGENLDKNLNTTIESLTIYKDFLVASCP